MIHPSVEIDELTTNFAEEPFLGPLVLKGRKLFILRHANQRFQGCYVCE